MSHPTNERKQEFLDAAMRVVREFGIEKLDRLQDWERASVLRALAREFREQTGGAHNTARQHIAQACGRLRHPRRRSTDA